MDLQQLDYFRTVARTQHVTQAAEELGMTQPALSRAIARLEREVGVKLFDHHGRSVRLNRYGSAFLKHVERALGTMEEGRREVTDMADRDAGIIAFGFAHALGTGVVPDLIARFRDKHPRARFQLLQNASHIILDELEAGEVDLALVSPVPKAGERIASVVLASEELYAAVPHDHRFAGRTSIKLAQLADEAFICLREGYALRSLTDGFCRQAGFTPKIAFEGEEIATLRALVSVGLGVAMIPAPASSSESSPPLLHITEPACQRSIGLLWENERYRPQLTEEFRKHIVQTFA